MLSSMCCPTRGVGPGKCRHQFRVLPRLGSGKLLGSPLGVSVCYPAWGVTQNCTVLPRLGSDCRAFEMKDRNLATYRESVNVVR